MTCSCAHPLIGATCKHQHSQRRSNGVQVAVKLALHDRDTPLPFRLAQVARHPGKSGEDGGEENAEEAGAEPTA